MTNKLSWDQHTWRWRILIATYFGYAGYYLTRKVFTIAKTSIAEDLGWELGDTAHIWTAFLVAYMAGQFINSFIGRKWGPRVLLLGGLGVSIVLNVALGFSNSFATFLIFMAFNGLAQASGWPGVVGGISEWLRDHERGTIMGLWTTSYTIGNMLVKGLGGYLLGAYGWNWSFFGCTLLTAGVWLLLYLWQRDKPEDVGLEPIIPQRDGDERTVRVTEKEHVSFREYLGIAMNPVILTMGVAYFCVKFMRYALDSWLPAFLNLQGLSTAQASYYSGIFDLTGLVGVVVAGFLLDRLFRGNWAALCFAMAVGTVGGYVAVMYLGTSPQLIAICFGIVGFMLYGPDSILSGAACVQVAGEKNGVAVAGMVNGMGSIGPVVQEQVIGWLVRGDEMAGMRNSNMLMFGMSIVFACLMIVMMWRLHITHRGHAQAALETKS